MFNFKSKKTDTRPSFISEMLETRYKMINELIEVVPVDQHQRKVLEKLVTGLSRKADTLSLEEQVELKEELLGELICLVNALQISIPYIDGTLVMTKSNIENIQKETSANRRLKLKSFHVIKRNIKTVVNS